ncbi:MAG: glycosyltransferase [Deltaproteobacteria bacterium]|nr:glycosyltransferase [Deltaproteobacteria bacterium]
MSPGSADARRATASPGVTDKRAEDVSPDSAEANGITGVPVAGGQPIPPDISLARFLPPLDRAGGPDERPDCPTGLAGCLKVSGDDQAPRPGPLTVSGDDPSHRSGRPTVPSDAPSHRSGLQTERVGASAPRRTRKPRVLFFRSGYFLDREIRSALARLDWPFALWEISDFRDASKDRGADFKRLLETIKGFRPDIALTVNHLGFDSDGVLSGILGRLGVPAASWFVDSPWYILGGAELNPYRDLWAFSWDSDYLATLTELGFQNVAWLPLAADETLLEGDAARDAAPDAGSLASGAGEPRRGRDIAFVGDSLDAATAKYLALAGAGREILPEADAIAERFLESGELFPDMEAAVAAARFASGVTEYDSCDGVYGTTAKAVLQSPAAYSAGGRALTEIHETCAADCEAGVASRSAKTAGRRALTADRGALADGQAARATSRGVMETTRGAMAAGRGAMAAGCGILAPTRGSLAGMSVKGASCTPSPLAGVARDPQTLLNLSALVTWRASRMARVRVLSAMPPGLLTVAGDPGWKGLLSSGVTLSGRVDYHGELPGFYRGSKVNLNVTSAQMKTGVNQRVFDAPAAGGFLLTDRREQLERLFGPDERCCYSDPAEASEKALWHLVRPEARVRTVEAARRAVARRHLYRHRLPELTRAVLGG